MSLTLTLRAILERHSSSWVRSVDPERRVWRLQDPGLLRLKWGAERQNVEVCKQEILRAVTGSRMPILISHEDPCDNEVPGAWVSVGTSTWRVPEDFDLSHRNTQSWLDLVNWFLYNTCVNATVRPVTVRA